MDRIINKFKNKSGFSFTELLAATIIMMLAGTLVTNCINIAQKQFRERTTYSEAGMLLASLSTAVQSELTYAGKIEPNQVKGTDTYKYTSDSLGSDLVFSVVSENGATASVVGKASSEKGRLAVGHVEDGKVKDIYELVSQGAYKTNSGSEGNLSASMTINASNDGQGRYNVYIAVYSQDNTQPITKNTFSVGNMGVETAGGNGVTGVDTSAETYTLTLEPGNENASVDGKAEKGKNVEHSAVPGSSMELPKPINDDKEKKFTGWLSSSGQRYLAGDLYTFRTRKDVLTAQWNDLYQIVFLSSKVGESAHGKLLENGVPETKIDNIYAESGTAIASICPQTQADPGYEFDGWIIDETNAPVTMSGEGQTCIADASLTVYATWKAKTYTARFVDIDVDNGTETVLKTVENITYHTMTYGQIISEYDGAATIGTRTLAGWYIVDSSGNKIDVDKNGSTQIAGDVTFYAKWSEKTTCTVTFDANGGLFSPGKEKSKIYVVNDITSGNSFKDLGKVFPQRTDSNSETSMSRVYKKDTNRIEGWYTEKEYINKVDNTTKITGDIRLYARWQFSFILNPNAGTINKKIPGFDDWVGKSLIKYMDLEGELPPEIPENISEYVTRSGYTPVGLSEKSTATTNTFDRTKKVNKRTTIYIIWSKSSSGGCLVAGTQIRLADGSTKAIEDITYSDELAVWNCETGEVDARYPIWIEKVRCSDKWRRITFDDGSTLGTVSYHGVFSVDDNRFVSVDDPEELEVGEQVYKVDEDGSLKAVQVVENEMIDEPVTFCFVASMQFHNIIADDVITTDGNVDFANIYEFTNGLKWQEDRDTDAYDYDEFAGVVPRWLFRGLRAGEIIKALEIEGQDRQELVDLAQNHLINKDYFVSPNIFQLWNIIREENRLGL